MTPADLKAARKRLNLTQAKLADITGFSLSAIKAMERGARPVSPRIAKLIELLDSWYSDEPFGG